MSCFFKMNRECTLMNANEEKMVELRGRSVRLVQGFDGLEIELKMTVRGFYLQWIRVQLRSFAVPSER